MSYIQRNYNIVEQRMVAQTDISLNIGRELIDSELNVGVLNFVIKPIVKSFYKYWSDNEARVGTLKQIKITLDSAKLLVENGDISKEKFDVVINRNFPNYLENDQRVYLTWGKIDNAQSYRVLRAYKNSNNNQYVYTWYSDILNLEYSDFDLLPNTTYLYGVEAILNGIPGIRSTIVMIVTGMLSNEIDIDNINNFVLNQNCPNPFNPITTIQYSLPEESVITINVYDLAGRQIQNLVLSKQTSGIHSIKWNGTDQHGNLVPAGIYFYQLQAGDFVQTKKMVLMK